MGDSIIKEPFARILEEALRDKNRYRKALEVAHATQFEGWTEDEIPTLDEWINFLITERWH